MDAATPIPPCVCLVCWISVQELQQRHVGVLTLVILRPQRYGRQSRCLWVKRCIERGTLFCQYHTLMTEIERECQGDFVNYMIMPPAMSYEVLQRITSRITKSESYRRPIEPGLKLAIIPRYIVTGNRYMSLQYSFRVAYSTKGLFIPEVCNAIIDEYQNKIFAFPTNPEEWREVAQKLGERWFFLPHLRDPGR